VGRKKPSSPHSKLKKREREGASPSITRRKEKGGKIEEGKNRKTTKEED